jgi:hypothetical protein
MKTKMKIEPRVAPKVQQKMMLIYAGAGIALVSVVAVFLFFYLNLGNQEESYANNKTYTSIASGDWNLPSSWQSGDIPPISGLNKDAVIINNDVEYIGDVSVDNQVSITINGGASLTITGDLIVNNNLTLIINGDLIINGNLIAKNGAKVTVNGGGTASISQDANFDNNTVLWIDGNLEIGGNLIFGNNQSFGGNGIVSVGLSGCSEWSGPSDNCTESVILPITLLNFSVKKDGEDVIVKWRTAVELNNDYFDIERSSDGREFDQIARIEGSGTSHEPLDYEYVDTAPLNGMSYYRLRQTDFDGTTEAFDIHSIQNSSLTANNVTIFPNPLLGNTLKMVMSQPEEGSVEIMDENGNRVFSEELNDYDRELEMNLPDMKMGIYFVNVTTASMQKSFKLVKR